MTIEGLQNMTNGNGYTQKELNQMIFEKLKSIEEKLDQKLDKSEFYKVLALIGTIVSIVGLFIGL